MDAEITGVIEVMEESECRRWWFRRLHPGGVVKCPEPACAVCLPDDKVDTLREGGRVRCPSCGRWVEARTGTPFCGVHSSWAQLYLIAEARRLRDFPGFSMSDRVLAAWTGLSTDTIKRINTRLQELDQ